MMGIKVVDVFARNDIDFSIPVTIERIESSKLFTLLCREMGEVLEKFVHTANDEIRNT